jgi:hypothetical protein
VFIARFDAETAPAGGHGLPHAGGTRLRTLYSVRIDLRRRTILIFFDFEGAWSRLSGVRRSRGYPRRFPSTDFRPGGQLDPEPSGSDPRGRLLRGLVERAYSEGGGEEGPSLLEGAFHRRRLRRALSEGWLERRAFLDPAAVNESVDGLADQIGFVHARLRPGVSPEALLGGLVNDAGLSPFLFASDGERVLFAALTAEAISRQGAAPARSAIELLREQTSEIVTLRQSLASLAPVAAYRFDAMIDRSPESGEP